MREPLSRSASRLNAFRLLCVAQGKSKLQHPDIRKSEYARGVYMGGLIDRAESQFHSELLKLLVFSQRRHFGLLEALKIIMDY